MMIIDLISVAVVLPRRPKNMMVDVDYNDNDASPLKNCRMVFPSALSSSS